MSSRRLRRRKIVTLKTCWRRLQDMSSRRLQDMSSRRLQDMSSRCLQDVFSVTIFRLRKRLQDMSSRYVQDVFKTSSRRLGRQKIVTLKTCWRGLEDMSLRRLEDVFKTNKCLLGYYTLLRLSLGFKQNLKYFILPWSSREISMRSNLNASTNLCRNCWSKVTTSLKYEQTKLCNDFTRVKSWTLIFRKKVF